MLSYCLLTSDNFFIFVAFSFVNADIRKNNYVTYQNCGCHHNDGICCFAERRCKRVQIAL